MNQYKWLCCSHCETVYPIGTGFSGHTRRCTKCGSPPKTLNQVKAMFEAWQGAMREAIEKGSIFLLKEHIRSLFPKDLLLTVSHPAYGRVEAVKGELQGLITVGHTSRALEVFEDQFGQNGRVWERFQ